MKVSIIIPVYNVEKYITECLNSVIDIDINYEIIIINDGSKDNSLEKINEFTNQYKGEFKVLNKQNGGLSSARNTGIQIASGDYLFFLDSDDFINKQFFVSFIKDVINDGAEIGFGNYKYLRNEKIEANTEAAYRKKIAKRGNRLIDGLTFGNRFFDKANNFLNTEACFLLIKKSLIVDNNIEFKQNVYHEDTLFTITCLTVAKKVKYYDYPFYIYRVRDDSIMNNSNHNTNEKKMKDKGIIAMELFKLKEKKHISLTFIDSLIVDLLLVSAMHFKSKSPDIYRIISGCKKLSLKSRVRVALYKILSLGYN